MLKKWTRNIINNTMNVFWYTPDSKFSKNKYSIWQFNFVGDNSNIDNIFIIWEDSQIGNRIYTLTFSELILDKNFISSLTLQLITNLSIEEIIDAIKTASWKTENDYIKNIDFHNLNNDSVFTLHKLLINLFQNHNAKDNLKILDEIWYFIN